MNEAMLDLPKWKMDGREGTEKYIEQCNGETQLNGKCEINAWNQHTFFGTL